MKVEMMCIISRKRNFIFDTKAQWKHTKNAYCKILCMSPVYIVIIEANSFGTTRDTPVTHKRNQNVQSCRVDQTINENC